MSTIEDIEGHGLLVRLKVELDYGEFDERSFFVTPDVKAWLENDLPGLETTIAEGRLTPLEQVYARLHEFITGEKFICENGRDLHEMWPHHHDVWELKTVDVRLIGWFYAPKKFVCVYIDSKGRMEELKAQGTDLYEIYRNSTKRFRDELDIDPPKVASEEDVKNELCL